MTTKRDSASSTSARDDTSHAASAPPVPTRRQRLREHLWSDVHPTESHLPLTLYCAATGFVDAVTFTATITWAGFQTGNTIQLSIALARTFSGRYASTTSGFQTPDHFALVSVLSFLLGAALQQIGTRAKVDGKRIWHLAASLFVALLTLIAALCLINGSEHGQGTDAESRANLAWTGARGLAVMGLLSASLGLQGAIAKRLNTSFATTVVLTSVIIDIGANPNLFHFRRVRARDQRIYAIGALFLGGFAGRAILGGLGACPALGIAAGLRALIAFTWLLVPDAPRKAVTV